MTKPAPHTTSLTKHGRGPFLEAQWSPICTICGPIGDRTDLDGAKTTARRHPELVEARRLAATKAAPQISNTKEQAHDRD